MNYVPVDMDSARLTLYPHSSFANARDLRSQLGFVVILVDDQGRENKIHSGSEMCRCVTRSVMASELHSLTYGFDNKFIIQNLLIKKNLEAMLDGGVHRLKDRSRCSR